MNIKTSVQTFKSRERKRRGTKCSYNFCCTFLRIIKKIGFFVRQQKNVDSVFFDLPIFPEVLIIRRFVSTQKSPLSRIFFYAKLRLWWWFCLNLFVKPEFRLSHSKSLNIPTATTLLCCRRHCIRLRFHYNKIHTTFNNSMIRIFFWLEKR